MIIKKPFGMNKDGKKMFMVRSDKKGMSIKKGDRAYLMVLVSEDDLDSLVETEEKPKFSFAMRKPEEK